MDKASSWLDSIKQAFEVSYTGDNESSESFQEELDDDPHLQESYDQLLLGMC